jgi:raffinose/stachyose/melibiose transport system substrate-binding protein
MIPIYCGVEGEENAAVCAGTENMWAVNSQAAEEDIMATLDFLNWVVTSDEGTTMMAEQFWADPVQGRESLHERVLQRCQRAARSGKYVVTWAFNYTPNVTRGALALSQL